MKPTIFAICGIFLNIFITYSQDVNPKINVYVNDNLVSFNDCYTITKKDKISFEVTNGNEKLIVKNYKIIYFKSSPENTKSQKQQKSYVETTSRINRSSNKKLEIALSSSFNNYDKIEVILGELKPNKNIVPMHSSNKTFCFIIQNGS
jgi:hypothetical protein